MGVEEFKDLLLCCGNIYLWKLDSGGNLLQSNCPDEAVLGTAFELLGCLSRARAPARKPAATAARFR